MPSTLGKRTEGCEISVRLTIDIVEPGSHAIEDVRELWREYWRSAELPPEFQGFEQELASLPGSYAKPGGGQLLARIDGQPAATIAFRKLHDTACEAKRLFVRSAFRRRGLANALMAALMAEARRTGYRVLYGDTLPSMASALDLYRRLGFVETGPYSADPTPGAIYLRLDL